VSGTIAYISILWHRRVKVWWYTWHQTALKSASSLSLLFSCTASVWIVLVRAAKPTRLHQRQHVHYQYIAIHDRRGKKSCFTCIAFAQPWRTNDHQTTSRRSSGRHCGWVAFHVCRTTMLGNANDELIDHVHAVYWGDTKTAKHVTPPNSVIFVDDFGYCTTMHVCKCLI
jgi:hypothetical protein